MASTTRHAPSFPYELVIDTERQIVFNKGNMNEIEKEIYMKSQYMDTRPDYHGMDQFFFRYHLKAAEKFLSQFKYQLDAELRTLQVACNGPLYYEHFKVSSLLILEIGQAFTTIKL